MAVLREVKYLKFQQQQAMPNSAESLFSQNETFRKFVGNLELIVGWYNEVSRPRSVSVEPRTGKLSEGRRRNGYVFTVEAAPAPALPSTTRGEAQAAWLGWGPPLRRAAARASWLLTGALLS